MESDGYCSLVYKHVHLSDCHAATSLKSISRYQIKHIITCNIRPLENPLVASYLWIDAEDMPRQDMISYFETTYSFIEKAVAQKENVLVHCIAGISRSATIVIAYLMKKLKKPAQECLEKVRKERSVIDPNEGFMKQLKLYETMGYKLDVLNRDYRLIVLDQMASRLSRKHYALQTDLSNGSKSIVESYFVKLAATERLYKPQITYRCKKCRTQLFTDINVITQDLGSDCSSIYIEPQTWMISILHTLTLSDLNCPQCQKKIGFFDISGIDCDSKCTKHISIRPAFKININDIDACNQEICTSVQAMRRGDKPS